VPITGFDLEPVTRGRKPENTMCYLVTIGTRESEATLNALLRDEATLTPRGFETPFWLQSSDNPALKSIFPARDRLFAVTVGPCSCHLMPSDRKGGPHESFCRWLRKLALADGGLRVFIHWYSGSFDTEHLSNTGTIRVPVTLLVDASVLEADRLIEIVSPAPQHSPRPDTRRHDPKRRRRSRT
jgi:hypothetical protein